MPRRKQRRSWGHIDERIKGKKYVLRWLENTTDGRKRMCETFYGTYKQADARMSELEVLHGKDRPTPTMETACDLWYLPWLATRVETGKVKPDTAEKYKKVLNAYVLPRWRNAPVTAIKPIDIQSWLMTLNHYDAKLSLIVARTIMDFAVKYEVSPANKFRLGYELPDKKTKKSDGMYTLAQANEVFEFMRGKTCEPALILQLFGSCRVGESLAVKRSEVQTAECMGMTFALVPIVRQMSHRDKLRTDEDLKNSQSVRTIIIPEPYSTRLLELSSGTAARESEWLFPYYDGSVITYSRFMRIWNHESKPYTIPPSNMRRSWRTFAQYEWSIDYDTCELLMGHKLKGVTGEHYLKPSTNQLLEKVASAMKAFSQS